MRKKITRAIVKTVTVGGALLGVQAFFGPETKGRKVLRRRADELARELRNWSNRLEGVSHHLSGRQADPNVPDNVLADRIRSSLGRLEADLDLPHVHVMVQDRIALLHGDVARRQDATRIEEATASIPGIDGVESFLHIGLIAGDTRPSEGKGHPVPSDALRRLLSAVTGMGIGEQMARPILRAILSAFMERLPGGERAHVISHLPADVRELAAAPRRIGMPASAARTVSDLLATVIADGLVPIEQAAGALEAVLQALGDLVPEESQDISAVLPRELREIWRNAVPLDS